jgi:hypothetical protein
MDRLLNLSVPLIPLVLELGSRFPRSVIVPLMQIVGPALSSLDSAALVFYSHLCGVLERKDIAGFLPIIHLGIVTRIRSESPFLVAENERGVLRIVVRSANCDQSRSILPGSVDISQYVRFPELRDYSSLVRPRFLSDIGIVVRFVKNTAFMVQQFLDVSPQVVSPFMSSEHRLDIAAAMLLVCQQIISICPSASLPLELLLHEVVFDPSNTVFDPGSHFDEINTLRSLALELILESGFSSFQALLFRSMDCPLLFAEMVHRFLNAQNSKPIAISDVPVICQTFVSSFVYYQQIDPQKEEIQKAMALARLSIFQFLQTTFTNAQYLTAFYENPFFVCAYVPFVCDSSFRPLVLSSLQSYLLKEGASQNHKLIQQILTLVTSASQAGDVALLKDLLLVMDRVVCHFHQFAQIFGAVVSDLCSYAFPTAESDSSREFVLVMLGFLSTVSGKHPMTAPEIIALENLITSLYPKPTPELFSQIVHIIAGNSLTPVHPAFTIQNPKVLRLLVTVFLCDEMVSDVLRFIAKLCEFSVTNCEEAHRGEFDLYLISLLSQWRNAENISIPQIASALSLLMLIASTVSSTSVTHAFVSLLCPIDGKFFARNIKFILKSLSSLVASCHRKPVSVLPLVKEAFFTFRDLDDSPFVDGMSVTAWVKNRTGNQFYQPCLFTLVDQTNLSLRTGNQ